MRRGLAQFLSGMQIDSGTGEAGAEAGREWSGSRGRLVHGDDGGPNRVTALSLVDNSV